MIFRKSKPATETLILNVPDELLEQLHAEAKATGGSVDDLVAEACRRALRGDRRG